MSLGNDKQAYKQKSEVKKTGTDDQPVIAYKPAYKKLTKTAYSGCYRSSINDSENGVKMQGVMSNSTFCKPLEIAHLGTKKNPLSSFDNSGILSEADATRTRNLRIDSPKFRFVSACGQRVNDGQIKTYGTKVEPW